MSRKNLKEARQRAGLTQQVADELDISLRYYQFIENGDRTGDFILWDSLEDLLGIHQRKLRENKFISAKKIIRRNIQNISYFNKIFRGFVKIS